MYTLSVNAKKVSPQRLESLQRLLYVAQRGTGQSSVVARFLLGLYNGNRFPFDLTDFRSLDSELFLDCLVVLGMDNLPVCEVHQYFENGGQIWEAMARRYRFKDHYNHSWR